MSMNKKKPSEIQIDRHAGELVILWRDGSEGRYALEELRRGCPCAQCREVRGEADGVNAGGLTLLNPEAISATAVVKGFSYVGRYGIRIEWEDGHDHGIYTFDFFREVNAEG